MALIDLQRQVVEVCLGPEPSAEQLASLGDARIWRIYRDAIRKRLHGELEVAFKRTRAAAGEAAFERAFEHFLRCDPPRARFFHAVVGCFADSAVPFLSAEPGVPARVADLCAYEAALWAVSDLPDRTPEAVAEFGFDKQPVLASALRLLCLRSEVLSEDASQSATEPAQHFLCVHRRPEDKKARTHRLNAVGYDLMQRFVQGEQTVAQAVEAVATARSIAVDEPFLDGLCTMLADFIDRGVILGGR
jgi:hypothetical protein